MFELCCSSCVVRLESLSSLKHTHTHTHRYVAAVSEREVNKSKDHQLWMYRTLLILHIKETSKYLGYAVCREHVHGLVFQCVHCVDLALCLNCMETCLNCTDTSSLSKQNTHKSRSETTCLQHSRTENESKSCGCSVWKLGG